MKFSYLCLSLLLALVSFAATAEPPGDDRWLEHMKSKLNLTEQQVVEIKKIHEELKPEREALREQHKALHTKVTEKLKAVLNPEQQKQLEAMHEKHEHGMHGDAKTGMGSCAEHGGADMGHCSSHDAAADAHKHGKSAKAAKPSKAAEEKP